MPTTRYVLLLTMALLCPAFPSHAAEEDVPTPSVAPLCPALEEEKIARKLASYFLVNCETPEKIWETVKADIPAMYTIESQAPTPEMKCMGNWKVDLKCTKGTQHAAFYCERVRSSFLCNPNPTPVVKTPEEEDLPTNYPGLKTCLLKPAEFTKCATDLVMAAPSEAGCDLLGQTVRPTPVLIDACYEALAASREQEIFCDRIRRAKTRRNCFVQVAWAKQSPALCRRIDESDAETLAKCMTLGLDPNLMSKTQHERDLALHATPAVDLVKYAVSSKEEVRQAVLPSFKTLPDEKKKEVTDLILKTNQSDGRDKQIHSTRALAYLSGKQNVPLLEAALKKLSSFDPELRQTALDVVTQYQDLIEPRHYEALLAPLNWGPIGHDKIRPLLVSSLKSPKTEKDLWDSLERKKQSTNAVVRLSAEELESDLFSLNPYMGSMLLLETGEDATAKLKLEGKKDEEIVEQLRSAAPMLSFTRQPRVYEGPFVKAISLGELFKRKLGEGLSESMWVGVQIDELTKLEGLPMVKVSFLYADQNCKKNFDAAKKGNKYAGTAYVPLYAWDGKLNFALAEEEPSCNTPTPKK